ncbi:MAG: hypothetical protein DCC67_04590 [Planctomycetota bacterium]|nr:MAG: hypothetical protein DCC67_04590 [Planctomycetota bacterium]
MLVRNAFVLGGCVTLLAPAAFGQIVIERVFGPEAPGGRYKHPAAIEELAGGDLYIAFYGGAGEYEGDTAVYGSRRAKGTDAWSTPRPIADTPDRSDGNPVVWQQPGGPVWLFYVVRYGETWADSIIKFKKSLDGARTWTDSDMLTFERGMMVRSQPIELADGDILLPIYHEVGNDRESVGAGSSSLFARFDNENRQWEFTEKVHSRLGAIQPAVVQCDDMHLLAFCRRGGGYGHQPDGFMVKTESFDGGRTWTPGVDTEYPNPNAAVDLIRLANGHLVMVYNHSFEGERMPLTMRISTDGGKTWPHGRNVVDKPGDTAAYPYFIQTSDGRIHGVYTSAERTVVNHIMLDEADIVDAPQRQ